MDKINQGDSEEIPCVDPETGKWYIMNIKTGQVIREVKPDESL